MALTGSLLIFLKFPLLLMLLHTILFCRSWTQCSHKWNQIFPSHFKKELSISWPTNRSGADSACISECHLPSNYDQIALEGLHKFFVWEKLNIPFLYGSCYVLENTYFWSEKINHFICLQLFNTACNWCHNHRLYIWQSRIYAYWAVSKMSLSSSSKDIKWAVIHCQ